MPVLYHFPMHKSFALNDSSQYGFCIAHQSNAKPRGLLRLSRCESTSLRSSANPTPDGAGAFPLLVLSSGTPRLYEKDVIVTIMRRYQPFRLFMLCFVSVTLRSNALTPVCA